MSLLRPSWHSAIDRLSDDDLRLIFEATKEDFEFQWEDEELVQLEYYYPLRAMHISQVCARWRVIALNSPQLWTTVSLNNPLWVPIQLERSRYALLDVYADWPFIDPSLQDIELLTLILDHLRRIRVLALGVCDVDGAGVAGLRPYLYHPAPQLRRVSLSAVFPGNCASLDEPPFSRGPPSGLLQLSLRNVAIPWPESAAAWPHLTRLQISLIGIAKKHRFSLFTLLETLAHFPKLEYLKLEGSTLKELRSRDRLDEAQLHPKGPKLPEFADNGTGNCRAANRIFLPALRQLCAQVRDLYSAVELSRHIFAHPNCSISYVCGTCSPPDEAYHPSPTILFQNLLPNGVEPLLSIDKLDIYCTLLNASVFVHMTLGQGYYTSCADDHTNTDVALQNFSFTCHNTPQDFYLDFVRIATQKFTTDITRIRFLAIKLPIWDSATKSVWRECFSRCTAVETLQISYQGLFLLSPSHTESGLQLGELAFPRCRSLEITNADPGNLPPPPPTADTILQIIKILQLRRNAHGCGLETLRVSGNVIPRNETMRHWRDLWEDCAEVVIVEDRIV